VPLQTEAPIVERVAVRRVLVLIPAHNEAAGIAATLASVRAQLRPADRVVVVCDNCTDQTAQIAREQYGLEAWATVANTHKKAGALNQALAAFLPGLHDRDLVLVMDADTQIDPDFIEWAERYVDSGYAAVGGTFRGAEGGGFVGMLQRNEYARYERDVRRRHGKALVLTGTATLFCVAALRDVLEARASGALPGREGELYDTHALTEDNELTLALRHRGWPIIAPAQCAMTTEVMTTWAELWRQRLRWKRGAVENLTTYGLTSVTATHIVRQLWSLIGLVITGLYLGTVAWSVLGVGHLQMHPVWLAISLIFALERVVTVRSRGLAQMALSAVLVVEMPYDIFLQGAQFSAYVGALTGRKASW
jgi:cellulose synthase/poly-beta-1,6-N-acetylglucosamine synthase-like glycosyltransferase